jgi:DNA-directed RNA polymerase specialized sigma24 family protein
LVLAGAFEQEERRQEFRKDLEALQVDLRKYAKALANIAGVEDLTGLVFD